MQLPFTGETRYIKSGCSYGEDREAELVYYRRSNGEKPQESTVYLSDEDDHRHHTLGGSHWQHHIGFTNRQNLNPLMKFDRER